MKEQDVWGLAGEIDAMKHRIRGYRRTECNIFPEISITIYTDFGYDKFTDKAEVRRFLDGLE